MSTPEELGPSQNRVKEFFIWTRGHQELRYLAHVAGRPPPGGADVPERMQSEQYFKDSKQRSGLNRSTVTPTDRLQRLLVGLLACCTLI